MALRYKYNGPMLRTTKLLHDPVIFLSFWSQQNDYHASLETLIIIRKLIRDRSFEPHVGEPDSWKGTFKIILYVGVKNASKLKEMLF